MIAKINTENLQQYKSKFSLIMEEILAFASRASLFGGVKNKFSSKLRDYVLSY